MTALGICLFTIPTAFLMPGIQIDAIFNSSTISNFVSEHLINSDSKNHCITELIWICSIYLLFGLTIATGYFLFLRKIKIGLLSLIILLGLEFYVLQTPFFIFEVGTYYNCESDGQTIMAAMASSPKVSLTLIVFGVVYDIVNNKRNKTSI